MMAKVTGDLAKYVNDNIDNLNTLHSITKDTQSK